MTTATRVLEAPVTELGTPPIARGVIADKGYTPWDVLYRSLQEQSIIDHQLSGLHRATNRILTAPLDRLSALPLLSNPGRLQLPVKPWAAKTPAGPDGKFVKVNA